VTQKKRFADGSSNSAYQRGLIIDLVARFGIPASGTVSFGHPGMPQFPAIPLQLPRTDSMARVLGAATKGPSAANEF